MSSLLHLLMLTYRFAVFHVWIQLVEQNSYLWIELADERVLLCVESRQNPTILLSFPRSLAFASQINIKCHGLSVRFPSFSEIVSRRRWVVLNAVIGNRVLLRKLKKPLSQIISGRSFNHLIGARSVLNWFWLVSFSLILCRQSFSSFIFIRVIIQEWSFLSSPLPSSLCFSFSSSLSSSFLFFFFFFFFFFFDRRSEECVHSRTRDIKKSAHTRCMHCESELRIWERWGIVRDVTDAELKREASVMRMKTVNL